MENAAVPEAGKPLFTKKLTLTVALVILTVAVAVFVLLFRGSGAVEKIATDKTDDLLKVIKENPKVLASRYRRNE